MSLFHHTKGTALIHRLDPRTKIIILIASFILPLLFDRPLFIFVTTILVSLHLLISRAWANMWRFKGLLITLFFFTFIIWVLSARSFLFGISMAIRIVTLVTAGIIFISTTRIEELSLGLIRLGLPYSISFALTTAFRMVPTFIQTGAITLQAQRLRGLDLKEGGIKRRIKNYIPLLVPIFINSLRNTHQLSMALESRGFSAHAKAGEKEKRTFYLEIGFKKADIIIIILLITLLVSVILFKYYGGD